jgi:hypothetical protein
MAKAIKKQTIDDNGNIVEVDVAPQNEISEVADIKATPIKKQAKKPDFYVFQLVRTVYQNSPDKLPYPENWLVKNRDIIYDEETNTERNIRYLEGVSTIYEDEQDHLSEQKQNARPDIRFVNGYLRVPTNKPSLLQFLMKSNMNASNKHRMAGTQPLYKMLDFQAEEEKNMEKAEIRMDAMRIAMDAPLDMMIPHAKYLGIAFVNRQNVERGEKAIRFDYLNIADKNPDMFIKTYNNPLVKIQYIVQKAMNAGLVDTSTIKGQAIWGDSKSFIVQIPDGKQPLQFLAEFCLTAQGKEFYSQIKHIIND